MNRNRSDGSGLPGPNFFLFRLPGWQVGLFLVTLVGLMVTQLVWRVPVMADPNPDIALLSAFVPNKADPGFPSVYRLTFRSITGTPVNITSLSHTLPSAPGSLVFDATAPITNTCGSTFTINNPGSNPGAPGDYTVTGGTIPGGDPGECVIEIPVKGFESGNHTDTIPAGALVTDVGENPDPTSATLEVESAANANINKSFSPSTIPGNGRSTVTIRVNNSNDFDLTGTTTPPTLEDLLPSSPNQMTVDTRPGAPAPTTTCSGGTVNIKPGDTGIELLGGIIPANSNCTITFPVTQANGGTYTNNIPANSLSTENQVSNGNNVNANLNIQTEVSITKNMVADTLDEAEVTTLTISVTNGSAALTNAGLTDSLPAPLVVADVPNATTDCNSSGTFAPFAASPGDTSVSLVGGEIPSSDPSTNGLGSCQIIVDVKVDPGAGDNIPGVDSTALTNDIPAGALTNDQGQTNANPASDNIRVRPALRVTKGYSNSDQISPGASTLMTIRIQNRSNAEEATGVNFVDPLPAPLEVAAPLDVNYSGCGGGTIAPLAPGTTTLNFSGGTINPNGNCFIRIAVYVPPGTSTGNLDNIIPNDSIGNDQGFDSNGVTGNEGRLEVVSRVVLTKAFNANEIRRGTRSQVILRIENNRRNASDGSALPLTGVDIADNLPPNLHIANPANFSHVRCNYNTATGNFDGTDPTFTGNTPGSTSFTMADATLSPVDDGDPEADTCEIRFDVEEIDRDFNSPGNETPRLYTNTTSGFDNDQGENVGETATATLNVISPLDGEKSFQSEQIVAGGRSTAVIQLNNSLPDPLTVVSFTDDWTQANTVVATPANTSTTCGGTVTVSGPRAVALTGGTVPPQVGGVFGLCEIRFDVVMDATGPDTFTNTIEAGSISTNEGFVNAVDVSGPVVRTTSNLNVNKSFSPNSLIVGDPSTLTITVTNPNGGIPVTELGFTDSMPTNMVVFSLPNPTTSCGGTVTANSGENFFSFAGGTLGPNESCVITVQTTLIETGNKINELPPGTIETKENVTNSQLAQATVNALTALKPAKSFNPTSVEGGEISRLTLTIQNLQQDSSSGESLQNVTITDNLPVDVFVASTPNAFTDCPSGTVNVTPGGAVVNMSGATLAPQASCVVQVDVVSAKQGSYENIIDRGDLTGEVQPSLQPPSGDPVIISNTSRPKATLEVTSDALPPELLLIKRITAVNGVAITGFDDGPGPEDNDPQWPSGRLQGVIDYTTPVTTGDELEYTIYYLNTGLGDATNVRICDRIPGYTTFFPTGYNSGPAQAPGGFPGGDRGMVLAEGSSESALTNADDGDAGIYFGPGTSPQTVFPGITCNGDDSNGTVVVTVPNTVPPATGAGTPPTSSGYIRFKAVVN